MKQVSLFFILIAFGFSHAFSQLIKVGNVMTFSSLGPGGGIGSAEGGSVVIPPGLRTECPKGRILISRDNDRPPNTGAVVYRDLDKPTSAGQNATFDNPLELDNVGNDHDLILLPNGDILYVTVGYTWQKLDPKPWWFDNAYYAEFGPGARSTVFTWRSKDAGKTFQFLSRYDAAKIENGIPAYPQFRLDSNKIRITTPPWGMGGTDGTLATTIPGSDQLYMTSLIAGYSPKYDPKLKMLAPDTNSRVRKTLLLTSVAGGPWSSLGLIDGTYWRLGMVPFTDKDKSPSIIFAPSFDNIIFTGTKDDNGKFVFTDASRPSGDSPGWTDWSDGKQQFKLLNSKIWAGIWANTVISRCPGDGINALLVYPSTLNGIHGCSVYFYDQSNDKFQAAQPLLPQGNSVDDCIFHPTIIDSKTGPLLLYWYDMNSKTMTARIRGRIIDKTGDYSPDFDISILNNIPYSFDLKSIKIPGKVVYREDTLCWYGDYHTADGYVDQVAQPAVADSFTAHFFPRWVQPDSTFRYTEVTYRYKRPLPNVNIRVPALKRQVWPLLPRPWEKPFSRISLDKINVDKMRLQVEEIDKGEQMNKTINVKKRQ